MAKWLILIVILLIIIWGVFYVVMNNRADDASDEAELGVAELIDGARSGIIQTVSAIEAEDYTNALELCEATLDLQEGVNQAFIVSPSIKQQFSDNDISYADKRTSLFLCSVSACRLGNINKARLYGNEYLNLENEPSDRLGFSQMVSSDYANCNL